jgi:hypothetical protein
MRPLRGGIGDSRGVTFVEILVVVVLFALIFLTVDNVFIAAHRSSQQAELTAEVGQNARIAVARLTREIREAAPGQIECNPSGPGCAGTFSAVAFRSARPANDRIFCLNVPNTSDRYYHGVECDYYGGPPVAGVTNYTPVWQRIVGYRLVATSGPDACGPYDLHRYFIDLTTDPATPALPANPASPGTTTGSAIVASCVNSFQVSLVHDGGTGRARFRVVFKGQGQRRASGAEPVQQIELTGEAWVRND